MKNLIVIFFLIVLIQISYSQEIVTNTGGSGSGTGIFLEWSIGEPVTSTTYGVGFILTQGFHQGQPQIERYDQQINFSTGWNIISLNIIPENIDLMHIFQPLIDDKILNKIMDETGATIEDWGVYGGWKNGIGLLSNAEGYKVNVNSSATFSIEGITFLFPFNISLKTGWNIISWPPLSEQDGMEVFQPLISDGIITKIMDEAGNTIEDWGVYGGWKNGIGNFKPGKGYKVNVTSDCTLTINVNGAKSNKAILIPLSHKQFVPVHKGNGTDHMNINLVNLSESGIIEGDEIGIFDENECVGSAIISRSFINSNQIGIPVSADDKFEGINGFSNGNTISCKLYRNGIIMPVKLIPVNNQNLLFERGRSLFAMIDTDFLSQYSIPLNNCSLTCYPNPFKDEINIELNLELGSQVSIEVLNQTGQSIRRIASKQNLKNGLHKFSWNGKTDLTTKSSPGIYHLRVLIGERIMHKKIVFTGEY